MFFMFVSLSSFTRFQIYHTQQPMQWTPKNTIESKCWLPHEIKKKKKRLVWMVFWQLFHEHYWCSRLNQPLAYDICKPLRRRKYYARWTCFALSKPHKYADNAKELKRQSAWQWKSCGDSVWLLRGSFLLRASIKAHPQDIQCHHGRGMREGNERDRESLDLRAVTDADADADTHLMTTLKTGWVAFMNTGNGACMSVPAVAAPAAPPSPSNKDYETAD